MLVDGRGRSVAKVVSLAQAEEVDEDVVYVGLNPPPGPMALLLKNCEEDLELGDVGEGERELSGLESHTRSS